MAEGIVSGRYEDFASLKRATRTWPRDQRTGYALSSAFQLLRRVNWGIFSSLSPERYPRLWSELVLGDDQYDFAGDLKRNMSLPNIFVGMLDLHGYTSFCRENRKNLSRLELLDRMIQDGVSAIAASVGVISRRSRGDEILLIGASAGDVLEAALLCSEYFGDGAFVDPDIPEPPPLVPELPVRDPYLPRFTFAGGIAGGQGFTDLVVTRDGDLSGDAVNAAARLQARASRISSTGTRILVTNHVYRSLLSEREKGTVPYRLLPQIDFVDAGKVEFKGLRVSVYDTILATRDAKRLSYSGALEDLYGSIDAGLWKSRVFDDATRLLFLLATAQVPPQPPERLLRIKAARDAFSRDHYEVAFEAFSSSLDAYTAGGEVDELALSYLKAVRENYGSVMDAFAAALDVELETGLSTVLNAADRERFSSLQKNHDLYVKVRSAARMRVRNRRALWFRSADSLAPELGVRIESMK